MLLLTTTPPPSDLSFGGGFAIHLYGLAIAVGILLGFFVTRALAKRLTFPPDDLYGLVAWLVPVSLVGARLYHVLNEWGYYADHPGEIVAVWNGGLAIHGAILAGLITVFVWARRRRASFWSVTDLLAPGLILGQAIGRWGNYFNQELYGKPTDLPWAIPIDLSHRLPGYESFAYFHPLFLYESLLDLALFAVLFFIVRRGHARLGTTTALYFIGYSVIRFSLDFLRINPVGFGWLTLAQAVSVVMAVAGVIVLFLMYRKTNAAPSAGS